MVLFYPRFGGKFYLKITHPLDWGKEFFLETLIFWNCTRLHGLTCRERELFYYKSIRLRERLCCQVLELFSMSHIKKWYQLSPSFSTDWCDSAVAMLSVSSSVVRFCVALRATQLPSQFCVALRATQLPSQFCVALRATQLPSQFCVALRATQLPSQFFSHG